MLDTCCRAEACPALTPTTEPRQHVYGAGCNCPICTKDPSPAALTIALPPITTASNRSDAEATRYLITAGSVAWSTTTSGDVVSNRYSFACGSLVVTPLRA